MWRERRQPLAAERAPSASVSPVGCLWYADGARKPPCAPACHQLYLSIVR
jgi:hypothetical protein